MPPKPRTMEGQGVGRTLRLLRNRLPRLGAGQNWIAYFLFGVILSWAVSSWSACSSFFFLYMLKSTWPPCDQARRIALSVGRASWSSLRWSSWYGHKKMPYGLIWLFSTNLLRAHEIRLPKAGRTVSGIRPPRAYAAWLLSFYISAFFFLPVLLCSFKFPRTGMETAHLALVLPSDWWCLVRLGYQHWPCGLEACKLPRFSHTVQNGGMEYSRAPCISILGPSQSTRGEAVPEPERTQEHSLSSFAGGQHFFEYLLVVSLKKKRSGDDYEPTITYQFPKVRMEEGWGLRTEWGGQRCV